MKTIKFNKRVSITPPQFNKYVIGLVLFAFLMGNRASAQPFYTSTATEHAWPYNVGASNTGHAVLAGNGDNGMPVGCNITATVWDGDHHTAGINVSMGVNNIVNRKWTSLLGGELSDPDVTIAWYNKEIYIAGTGVTTDNLIALFSLKTICNDHDQFDLQVVQLCTLGTNSNAFTKSIDNGTYSTDGRKCSHPNIDANKDGKIALVWQEGQSYNFHLDFPAPVPPFTVASPGFVIDRTYWEGNIMAMHGYVDGSRYDYATVQGSNSFCNAAAPCTTKNSIKTYNGGSEYSEDHLPNYFMITGEEHEFNSTSDLHHYYHPDVSIGQGTNPYVTYAYMNNGQLNVYQQPFGVCNGTNADRNLTCFTGWVGDEPRVASKPTSDPMSKKDFVVVGGYESINENCFGTVTGYTGSIVGVFANGTLPSCITAVSLNSDIDIRASLNSLPVVDYLYDEDGDLYSDMVDHGRDDVAGSVVVTWQSTNVAVPDIGTLGKNKDIIGRLYTNTGSTLFPHTYTFVNNSLDYNQYVPSVSARYGNGAIGYAFLDENHNNVVYKLSDDAIGGHGLDNDVTGHCDPLCSNGSNPEIYSIKPSLNLYPNPGTGQFTLKLSENLKGKQAIITVSDAKGHILLKQTWNGGSGEPSINAKDLPAGIYYVTYIPTEGNPLKAVYTNNK